MAVHRITPTSGADGADIDSTNTPGMDLVVRTGSFSGVGTAKIETSNVLAPLATRSMRLAKDSTNGSCYVRFDETVSATAAVRFYLYMNALPTGGSASFFSVRTAANSLAFGLSMTTAGRVQATGSAAVTFWNPNTMGVLSIGVLYRVEIWFENHDTNGKFKCRIIRDSDSVTMVTTVGYAGADGAGVISGIDMANADVSLYRFGSAVSSGTWVFDLQSDIVDIDPGATDYMPAWSSTGDPTPDAEVDGAYQFVNCQGSAPFGSDTSCSVQSVSPSTGVVIAENAEGDIGFFAPNTTQTYTVTIEGEPSGETATVDVDVTQISGATANVAAPLRPTGSVPGTAWG